MELNVLYACDENYAPYTGVSITSLFENNKDIDTLRVYLAGMGFSEETCCKMKQLAESYGREINFLSTKRAEEQIAKYQCKGWNGSLATWLRFFVLEQIPDEIHRILWLDSDTIVQKNLKDLCLWDLKDLPVACVCDSICYYERFRLGFSEAEPYFNAGVILFNLDYWRVNNTIDGMFTHLMENVQRYTLNDQDLLNDYFRGKCIKLPPMYNFQGTLLAYSPKAYFSVYPWCESAFYTPDMVQNAANDPAIIHFFRFLGDYPWQQGDNHHPARELYEMWKSRSLWQDHTGAPERKERIYQIEKVLYKVLPQRLFLQVFSFVTNRKLPKQPVK